MTTNIKSVMDKFLPSLFKNIVGQERVKKEARFYLDSYFATRMMPNMMIIAPKGQGKTTIAREVAKGLVQFDDQGQIMMVPSKTDPNEMRPKRKSFVEVNCSTLKSVKSFINGLIVPYVQDKDVTLLFDEASEIPRDVTMALLTILNPNPENRTTFALDEYVCDFDFRRQTFIFATSEPQKVFHALADRLERITLQDYSPDDLARIVMMGLPNVSVEKDVMNEVSTVLRGNARAAQKMSGKIAAFLKTRSTFLKNDWNQLKEMLSIAPLGLNATEIMILRLLRDAPDGTSLTGLSAKTGLSREALRADAELYLLRHGLLSIETTGRMITAKGQEYLKNLPSYLTV